MLASGLQNVNRFAFGVRSALCSASPAGPGETCCKLAMAVSVWALGVGDAGSGGGLLVTGGCEGALGRVCWPKPCPVFSVRFYPRIRKVRRVVRIPPGLGREEEHRDRHVRVPPVPRPLKKGHRPGTRTRISAAWTEDDEKSRRVLKTVT